MNFQEMTHFNKKINLNELREYRKEVSIKTRLVFEQLTDEIIKRKVSQNSLTSISSAGSVVEQDSWLLHYWGKKQLSGIITMPLTRHLLVHINSAIRML